MAAEGMSLVSRSLRISLQMLERSDSIRVKKRRRSGLQSGSSGLRSRFCVCVCVFFFFFPLHCQFNHTHKERKSKDKIQPPSISNPYPIQPYPPFPLAICHQKTHTHTHTHTQNLDYNSLWRCFLTRIELELSNICDEILKLLDTRLIPSTTTDNSKVFYLKHQQEERDDKRSQRERERETKY